MNGLVQVFSKVRGNTEKEEEKVVVDGGVWSVMLKCLIHVAPLCATIVLAAINLKGFFIGNNYLGSTEDTIQSLDQLLLQITAKLYVGFACQGWNLRAAGTNIGINRNY